MKAQPLGDQILVKELSKNPESKLEIPETNQEKSRRYEIVRIGHGSQIEPPKQENNKGRLSMELQKGMIIHAKPFHATEVDLLNDNNEVEKWKVINKENVLLVEQYDV